MRYLFLILVIGWTSVAQAAHQDSLERTLETLGGEVKHRITKRFELVGLSYPPERVQLIALKASQRLELWAYEEGRWYFIHDYAIFAASGGAGPKLREGDKQVPEGFYRIVELNPYSHYHLSMKLNYPNVFDQVQAGREGRNSPGSNIFIHGSARSAGCLAIGNHYIEELFYLIAEIGVEQAAVLIAPYDFRLKAIADSLEPLWLSDLYAYLKFRLAMFPLSEKVLGCGSGCVDAGYRQKIIR
ncbi:MAG: L,D-transpeptidase family protein [Candidatus Thiodiazotropha sp.]|jgi:hypothetical protein